MGRLRFPLTSEQLELLYAFETAGDLNELAEKMGRDPSVVSRNLQRLGSDYPVVKKINRRWTLTPLGQKINAETKDFLQKIEPQLSSSIEVKDPSLPDNAVLMVLNAQQALRDPSYGKRNNTEAEKNILKLLARWRELKQPIFHIRHLMEEKGALMHKDSPGYQYMEGLEPKSEERSLDKTKSSAFSQTDLATELANKNFTTLVLAGFTANECVDATARHACDLGFTTYVVSDATAMFDFQGPEGKLVKADRVHRLTMANLDQFFAQVLTTEKVLSL